MDVKDLIPQNLKRKFGPVYRRFFPYPSPEKHEGELQYWKREWQNEGGKFENGWYRRLMLAMAGETSDAFLTGKIVADFGCGPRGTLTWAESANERIGIDVLADVYAKNFDLSGHSMKYVTSTEQNIPLPSNYIDVLFTLNAMDHVERFDIICKELLRIVKPGGELIASFNLNEPPTPCEPQSLTEQLIREHLIGELVIKSYRVAPKGPVSDRYLSFYDPTPPPPGENEESILWLRAVKAV
jgi:ubiquinone/menaquinone biosynthesis C-methylase UbiE